jgi:hypothetical protein
MRKRDLIKYAASKYRGHKTGFGLLPRSFMKHRGPTADDGFHKQKLLAEGKHPSQLSIRSTGVLEKFMPVSSKIERAALGRAEQLLRLPLSTSKPSRKRSHQSTDGHLHGAAHGRNALSIDSAK